MKLRDENRLRELFLRKGIHKQVDMAQAVFLSENSVVRLFKGEKVSSSTAKRIASFLGCKIEEIFTGDAAPKVMPATGDRLLALA